LKENTFESAFPMRIAILFSLFAGLQLVPLPASAHEPGLSTATVTIDEGTADVVLTFSSDEVEAITLPLETGTSMNMEGFARGVMTISGIAPSTVRTDLSHDGDVIIHLGYTGLPRGKLSIEAPLLASFIPGHRQYLLVRDGRKHLLLRHFLTPVANSVMVEIGPD